MLRFTVNGGVVVLDPSVLLIKEFTDIIDYCKGDKDLSNRLLLYVFFCCDLTDNNPLKDIDYRLKEGQAERRAFGERGRVFKAKEKALIDAAIDAYNFLNETSIERSTIALDRKIDEIRTLLEELKPEQHAVFEQHLCSMCAEGTENVIEKYVSNAADLLKFGEMLDKFGTLKLRAMKTASEIENTGRVRGGKGSSMIERGVFRQDKD